jgi:hypothetical protein
MLFGKAWVTKSQLESWDEALLLVLRMQPSEIDELEMERYWFWVEVCEREINRRNELSEQMNR